MKMAMVNALKYSLQFASQAMERGGDIMPESTPPN
jgi:hypothetical protein